MDKQIVRCEYVVLILAHNFKTYIFRTSLNFMVFSFMNENHKNWYSTNNNEFMV